MKNYQRFVQYYYELRNIFEKRGIEDIDFHYKDRLFYKKTGIQDLEKIKQLEYQKSKEMHDRIELSLDLIDQYGSVYEITEDVKRYIVLNDAPDDKEIVGRLSLPFKSIFIETEITKEDFDIGVDAIRGLLIAEVPVNEQESLKRIGRAFIVYYFCEEIIEGDKLKFFIDEFKISYDNTLTFVYDDHKTLRFLKQFIANTLLFFNDPEVEIIEIPRDKKNRERRIKDGKLPLPSSRKIRLVGKLKKYMETVGPHLEGQHYHYKFWVRGHFRKLTSDKYTNMKGKVIKIEPYQKGQGVLLRRTYVLDFEKKDERLKEMKAESTFYDDIEPLKKPLRELREKGKI